MGGYETTRPRCGSSGGSLVTLFEISSRPNQASDTRGMKPPLPWVGVHPPSRRPLVHHLVVCSGTAPRYLLRCLNSLPLVPAQEKHEPPLATENQNLRADFSKYQRKRGNFSLFLSGNTTQLLTHAGSITAS